jgi:hypothetical protein
MSETDLLLLPVAIVWDTTVTIITWCYLHWPLLCTLLIWAWAHRWLKFFTASVRSSVISCANGIARGLESARLEEEEYQ